PAAPSCLRSRPISLGDFGSARESLRSAGFGVSTSDRSSRTTPVDADVTILRSLFRSGADHAMRRETATADTMATEMNTAPREMVKVTGMRVSRSDLDVDDAPHGDKANDLQDSRRTNHPDTERVGEQKTDVVRGDEEHDHGERNWQAGKY